MMRAAPVAKIVARAAQMYLFMQTGLYLAYDKHHNPLTETYLPKTMDIINPASQNELTPLPLLGKSGYTGRL